MEPLFSDSIIQTLTKELTVLLEYYPNFITKLFSQVVKPTISNMQSSEQEQTIGIKYSCLDNWNFTVVLHVCE